MRFNRIQRYILLGLLVGLVACSEAGVPSQETMTERQEAVATAGAGVMPFNLEATTHIFEKQADGGVQQVIADDPEDVEQIQLIRTHLAAEAERFQQGNFHDPQSIHGEMMPGVHELVRGVDRLTITYHELPDGAEILYRTDDPALVTAVHAWFDAQIGDHGPHADSHGGSEQ